MAGRTTIRELAKCSGVSVGTVSRALNGYPDVAPESRARVVRLAAELEHTPAAAPRTLGAEAVFVASDDIAGAGMAVEHLYRLGHRRIATITGLIETRPCVDRLRGLPQCHPGRSARLPGRVRGRRRLLRRQRP